MDTAEAKYLKINFDEILAKLKAYAKSKAEAYKAKAIILTGSLAKGNYTGTADADILVIADDLPTNLLERYALFAESRIPIDIEPRAYTTEEFIAMIWRGDHFALESLKFGIPLHGEAFFRDLVQSSPPSVT